VLQVQQEQLVLLANKVFRDQLVQLVQLVLQVQQEQLDLQDQLVNKESKVFRDQLVQQEQLDLQDQLVNKESKVFKVQLVQLATMEQYHSPHLVLPRQEQLMVICGSTPHQEMYSYTSPMV
jgi:hypothetical protein